MIPVQQRNGSACGQQKQQNPWELAMLCPARVLIFMMTALIPAKQKNAAPPPVFAKKKGIEKKCKEQTKEA